MKFKKRFLQSLAYDDYDKNKVEIVKQELVDSSRWSLIYEIVFKIDNKFYYSTYSTGATESQDESPYEYDNDEIECKEVFPVEKVVVEYI